MLHASQYRCVAPTMGKQIAPLVASSALPPMNDAYFMRKRAHSPAYSAPLRVAGYDVTWRI
jgi:hypothetical protein